MRSFRTGATAFEGEEEPLLQGDVLSVAEEAPKKHQLRWSGGKGGARLRDDTLNRNDVLLQRAAALAHKLRASLPGLTESLSGRE